MSTDEWRPLSPSAEAAERHPSPPEPDRAQLGFWGTEAGSSSPAAADETDLRLRAVIEQMSVGVMIASLPSGAFLFQNSKADEILGQPLIPVSGCGDYALYGALHADDTPYSAIEYPLARAVLSGEVVDREPMIYRRTDGQLVHLEVSAARVHDASNTPVLAACTFLDVSDRHEVEAALKHSEAKFRTITDAMPQIVWSTRPDGFHDYYNSRWYEFTGVPQGSTDGEGWNGLFHLEDQARAWDRWRHSLRTGEPYEIEYRLRHHSGEYRWTLGRALPMRGNDGQIIRWMGTCTDIHDQVLARDTLAKSAEELERQVQERTTELVQLQKMESLGQLTGGIAHDFNNLLTPIVGALDILERKSELDQRSKRLLSGAIESAERARTLVSRLLAFARRQKLQARSVNVKDLIEGIVDLIRHSLGSTVSIDLDVPEDLPVCIVDPNQLELALLNLCVNARDAMPGGGVLTICADHQVTRSKRRRELAPGSYVRISVVDTGDGMDPETLARATEPFFSTKGVGKGTGLGLSMVHGLAAQSGGTLLLSSEPGVGTRAELWLPAGQGEAERASHASHNIPNSPPRRVLLVDDEDLVRASGEAMLTELGHSVKACSSAKRALQLLESGASFDIVITDYVMAGMTGGDLATQIQKRWPNLPVLIVTGYNQVSGDVELLPRLQKPFKSPDIQGWISNLTNGTSEAGEAEDVVES